MTRPAHPLVATITVALVAVGCSPPEEATSESTVSAASTTAGPGQPTAETVLRHGDEFELYSVDPDLDFRFGGPAPDGVPTFCRWKSLGSTRPGPKTRERLVTALCSGMVDDGGVPVDCFEPRHGVRVTFDGQVHEFVICFWCSRIRWVVDGTLAGTLPVNTSPRDVFNDALTAAGLPLAK